MGEEEDMEEEVVTEEEVDTLGEEVVMEEEGEVEVDMVEEEVVVMEEEEGAVMEEGVVTVGEEVLAEEVVTSKGHKASPHRALDSRQVQRWVYVFSLYVKSTICHYTPSPLPTPSLPPHPHTLYPHHTPLPSQAQGGRHQSLTPVTSAQIQSAVELGENQFKISGIELNQVCNHGYRMQMTAEFP